MSPPEGAPARRPPDPQLVELVVPARPRTLGGFAVRRLLPYVERRLVGPFVFFDHMGPVDLPPGTGTDVPPHPHIGLATVTYLFSGEIFHRDSVGSAQAIRPGDVNWMRAGRGIVHSERSAPERRARGDRLHGIQAWVALPLADEEAEPAFFHHPAGALPSFEREGARVRLVAGTAYGARSPVEVASPTLYADATLADGATLALPDEHEERAVYVVEGGLACAGATFEPGALIVLRPGVRVTARAQGESRLMLLGGAPLEGRRHVWWNFVSSSKDRIERAKADWRAGRFPKVPGDDVDFVPLPDGA